MKRKFDGTFTACQRYGQIQVDPKTKRLYQRVGLKPTRRQREDDHRIALRGARAESERDRSLLRCSVTFGCGQIIDGIGRPPPRHRRYCQEARRHGDQFAQYQTTSQLQKRRRKSRSRAAGRSLFGSRGAGGIRVQASLTHLDGSTSNEFPRFYFHPQKRRPSCLKSYNILENTVHVLEIRPTTCRHCHTKRAESQDQRQH